MIVFKGNKNLGRVFDCLFFEQLRREEGEIWQKVRRSHPLVGVS